MRRMITLTTDWANNGVVGFYSKNTAPHVYPIGEHYVAQLKGILRQVSHDVEIVDVTHSIQAFNIIQTGFILRNAYPCFPQGTIHLVGVNSEPSPDNKILLIKHAGHYFVGADNGMFGVVFDGAPDEVRELMPEYNVFRGFASLGMFAEVVEYLMKNKEIADIGLPAEMTRKALLAANDENDFIVGRVAFIDNFGNLITNISEDMVGERLREKLFNIQVHQIKIESLSNYYDDVVPGKYLALFNFANLLEIAGRNCNLAQLEYISVGDAVRIDFTEKTRLFF